MSRAVSVVTQSRGWPRSREEHDDAVPVRERGDRPPRSRAIEGVGCAQEGRAAWK